MNAITPVGPIQPLNDTTPNLGLNKPLVGGDDNIWGGLLNANADTLDSVITSIRAEIELLTGILLFIGSYDAAADHAYFTGASGFPDGPLPPASISNFNVYLIVTVTGTGIGNAPPETLNQGDWLVSDSREWQRIPLGIPPGGEMAAANVTVTPAVLGANDVQAALQELEQTQGDYLPLAGGTLVGAVRTIAGNSAAPALQIGGTDAGLWRLATTVFMAAGGATAMQWSPGVVTAYGTLGVGAAPPANASGSQIIGGSTVEASNLSLNLYYDGSQWRYVRAGPGWVTNTAATGLDWLAAPSGAAGAVATLANKLSISAKGNLLTGGLPEPADAAAGNASNGGWFFGWGITASNVVSNAYYDGAAWRYLSAGNAWNVQQISGGNMLWMSAPSGAAGAVATMSTRMTLDPAGNLTAQGDVWANAGFHISSTGAAFTSDATATYQFFDSGNWRWQYTRSNGTLQYIRGSDNAVLFTIGSAGNVSVVGQFNAGGNVSAGSLLTAESGQMAMGNGGSGRYFQFSPQWLWDWNSVNGLLSWATPSGGVFTIDGAGNTHAGQVTSNAGRVLSIGTNNNPALVAYNLGTLYAAGIWVGQAGALQFGGCDGNGVPTVTYGYLSNVAIGFSGPEATSAVNAGANAAWWGSANDFNVPGNAWKPGGGAWADGSDARIKDVLGDYDRGLEAILALRPVRYRFKDNWKRRGSEQQTAHRMAAEQGTEYIGLVAQEVETVMPEMVGVIEAEIDGDRVDDLRTLDMSALPLAVVNAIQQLHARVAALEGQRS